MVYKNCKKFKPWNMQEIQPPPICTVQTLLKHAEVNELKTTLSEAVSTLKELNIFHKEAAILSRYLYRFKRIFRQDKGIQNLVKVNQGLRRYLKLNIAETLNNLNTCFPTDITPDKSYAYLPTQQMLKWALLRILSFSKIFVRIIDLSKEAGKYIYAKLCLGWSATYMIFALALTSRILAYSKFLLLNAIEWYNDLRRNLTVLEETTGFLTNFRFPQKLEKFIGDVDLSPPTTETDIDKIFELIDLTGVKEDGEDEVIITNEIILDTIDSDVEIYNSADEIIVDEIVEKKDKQDEEMSIVYEKTNINHATSSKLRVSEDLGSPFIQVRKSKKKVKKRKRPRL